jgi:WD40 repeat protein
MSRCFGTLVLLAVLLTLPMPTTRSAPVAKPVARTDAFGDPLPSHALLRIGTVRFRHGGAVSAIAVSPDGKKVYSVGEDKTIRVWELATGKELQHWDAEGAKTLALSPDGKRVVHQCFKTLEVHDALTGRLLHSLAKIEGWVDFLFFTGNTEVLYDGVRSTMHLINALTGEERLSFPLETEKDLWQVQTPDITGVHPLCIAVSRDASQLLISQFGFTYLWDVAEGKKLHKIGGNSVDFTAVALSPNKQLYAAGDLEGELVIGKVSGEEVQFLGDPQHPWPWLKITSLAFSPDSRQVACGDWEGKVTVYATATGKRLLRIDAHSDETNCLTYTPDGKSLVTGGSDGCIRVWDTETGQEKVSTHAHRGAIDTTIAADGSRVVTFDSRHTIRSWESANGKEQHSFQLGHWDDKVSLVLSTTGNELAAFTSEKRQSWDLETGRELRRIPYGRRVVREGLSPDGRRGVLWKGNWVGRNHTLTLVRAPAGRRLWEITRKELYQEWIFSPDSKWLGVLWSVSPTRKDPIQPEEFRVYETASGKEIHHFPLPEGEGPADLAPDKAILVTEAFVRDDNKEWKRLGRVAVETGAALPPFDGDQGFPKTFAISPDSKTLLMGDATGVLRLWEMATGKPRGILTGHRGPVNSLAFSADGRRLLSGSADTTALLWDMPSVACGAKPAPAELAEKELHALWADLRSDDAAIAYRAIAVLAAFPKESIPYVRSRLKAVSVDPKRLIQLVADLDSAKFETRQKAHNELADLAEVAEPLLHETLKDPPSAEVRRRVLALLEAVKTSPYVLTGERLRSWRALEALEQCGTSEACAVLTTLAKGHERARLTSEANRALERLRNRGVTAH